MAERVEQGSLIVALPLMLSVTATADVLMHEGQ